MSYQNISEFERTKPTETYNALQSLIVKYSTMVEHYNTSGKQLLCESTDVQAHGMASQFVNELNYVKSLFTAGR